MTPGPAGRLRRSLATSFLMGFTAGVPLLVGASLVQAWLTESGADLKVIGALGLTALPYALKFTWAFWLDAFDPPFLAALGRRRGWLLLSQAALFAGLWLLSFLDPRDLSAVAGLSLFLAFASATQDAVVDAYRREDLAEADLAPGAAAYIWGYRLGMLAVGGGGLMAAEAWGLPLVFRLTALLMLIGPLTLTFSPEPDLPRPPRPAGPLETVWRPLASFFQRPAAVHILLFIFFYKFGDQLAGTLTTAYYLKLGYAKATIGAVSKGLGVLATLAGVALGGWGARALGLKTSLWLFGFLQMASTLGFVLLYYLPVHPAALGAVVGQENLAAGAGTSAFAAFMAVQTDRGFSASQYALLTSLMALPRTLFSAPAGWLAETLGWPGFYGLSTALALPGFVLLFHLSRRRVFA